MFGVCSREFSGMKFSGFLERENFSEGVIFRENLLVNIRGKFSGWLSGLTCTITNLCVYGYDSGHWLTHTHTHTYVYYQTIEDFVFHQLTEDIISRSSSNTGLPTQLRTMSCCVRMSYLSPRPRTSG